MENDSPQLIQLPPPFVSGGLPLVEAIAARRSVRSFSPQPLQLFQLSQLLWAAQGITSPGSSFLSAPSAGGTFPLTVYVAIGEDGVERQTGGVFHYVSDGHSLAWHFNGDIRSDLADSAFGQDFISVAPVCLIIIADYEKTMARYNVRGERYVFMEAGHASQNIYLQATALNLGTVAVGAFREEDVRRILRLDGKARPLYLMPLGRRN